MSKHLSLDRIKDILPICFLKCRLLIVIFGRDFFSFILPRLCFAHHSLVWCNNEAKSNYYRLYRQLGADTDLREQHTHNIAKR